MKINETPHLLIWRFARSLGLCCEGLPAFGLRIKKSLSYALRQIFVLRRKTKYLAYTIHKLEINDLQPIDLQDNRNQYVKFH